MLTDKLAAEITRRGISTEFALASGVRHIADNEARELNFIASIPSDQRNHGLQGLCFEYADPWGERESIYRLRPEAKFDIGGRPAKYISRAGDPVRAYFPKITTKEILETQKIPVVITEGEFKALSIAENSLKHTKGKAGFAVIGLMGVNGGWHRNKKTVSKPDGSKERESYGPPLLIDDLNRIEWHKRRVYIAFDSDVAGRKHATEFKRSEYAGAMGAEHQLAKLLRAQGADVRIVEIPDDGTAEKVGADDYIVKKGIAAFINLFHSNWVAQRDPDKILNQARPEMLRAVEAVDLASYRPARPTFVIEKLLPEGGVCILAAAPKVGKSGIALNACTAVCNGDRFLNVYECHKGRAIYIQTEIPDWSMSDRLRLLGDLPSGFLVSSPRFFHVNFYETSGFQKKDTGNDLRVAALIEMLKQQAINLAVFDPLMYFHNLSERNEEDVKHVLSVFTMIARAVPCGVMLVHHHKKIGRSESNYEGAEDMSGSNVLFRVPDSIISIYRKKRSDDTYRYRMLIECRHAEEQPELELIRCDGDNAMVWYALPWSSNGASSGISEDGDAIVNALKTRFSGKARAKELMMASGISSSSFYREAGILVKAGIIRKSARIYEFPGKTTQPTTENAQPNRINSLTLPDQKIEPNGINNLILPEKKPLGESLGEFSEFPKTLFGKNGELESLADSDD